LAQTSNAPLARTRDNPIVGVLSLTAGITVFSVQDVIIKLISGAYPVHQAMTIRSLVALPLLLGLVALNGGIATLASRCAPLLLVRGAIMFSSYTSYYLALAALPMATCVALYFAGPLFITVLSALVLHERVDARRWAAVLIGFVGVLVIVRPGSDVFDVAALLPIGAGLAYAVSQTLARKLGEDQSAPVMAFYGNGVYILGGVTLALIFGDGGLATEQHKSLAFLVRGWATPSLRDLLLMMACGVIAAAGLTLLTQAYRSARASTVAPFEYTAILLSIVYGWVIWAELPNPVSWIGIAVVIGSGLYVLFQERSSS
jgi:drug/metabolite transporter (DMT)-like permease